MVDSVPGPGERGVILSMHLVGICGRQPDPDRGV